MNKVIGPSPPKRTFLGVSMSVVGLAQPRRRPGGAALVGCREATAVFPGAQVPDDDASATVVLSAATWSRSACVCWFTGSSSRKLGAPCRVFLLMRQRRGEGEMEKSGLSFLSPAPQLETQVSVGALPLQHTSESIRINVPQGNLALSGDLGFLDVWNT